MYLLVKFFLHCDFKHFAFDVSQILVRLKKKTEFRIKTGFRVKKTGFRIKKETTTIREDYYPKRDYYNDTTGKRTKGYITVLGQITQG